MTQDHGLSRYKNVLNKHAWRHGRNPVVGQAGYTVVSKEIALSNDRNQLLKQAETNLGPIPAVGGTQPSLPSVQEGSGWTVYHTCPLPIRKQGHLMPLPTHPSRDPDRSDG